MPLIIFAALSLTLTATTPITTLLTALSGRVPDQVSDALWLTSPLWGCKLLAVLAIACILFGASRKKGK